MNGGAVEFAYSRNKAALTELDVQVETAASPAGPWSAAGITETILTDDNAAQSVRASLPVAPGVAARFARLRVTKRLTGE